MEVIHQHAKVVQRSKGRSAVAAAAYRAGEKLHNQYDGITHDYTRRRGVVFTDILLPSNAPITFRDRETLWNSVEKIEKASNSQLARDVEFSLPVELDRQTQIRLVRAHVREQFVNHGMCADVAIHDKGDGNPHAHILLTMRPLEPDGNWGLKSKREYVLNDYGERIPLPSGDFKTRKISLTNWDDKGNAERWHEAWANACNRELERFQTDRRFTNKSYHDQSILLEPTVHIGKTANQMEKRGERSELGDINRGIRQRNAEIIALRAEVRDLEQAAQEQAMQPSKERTTIYEAPSAAQTTPASERETSRQPEIVAPQPLTLDDIKQKYIDLEIEIRRQKRLANDLKAQLRAYDSKREDLAEITGNVGSFSEEMNRLKEQRDNLPFYAVQDRRQLDDRIDKLTLSREQAARSLKNDYGIEHMERIGDRFDELTRNQAEIKLQLLEQPDIERLLQQQRELERSYTQLYEKAGPDRDKPQRDREKNTHDRSMADRMAATEAENRLKKLTGQERDRGQERERSRR